MSARIGQQGHAVLPELRVPQGQASEGVGAARDPEPQHVLCRDAHGDRAEVPHGPHADSLPQVLIMQTWGKSTRRIFANPLCA
jgi:hypothetical protein